VQKIRFSELKKFESEREKCKLLADADKDFHNVCEFNKDRKKTLIAKLKINSLFGQRNLLPFV